MEHLHVGRTQEVQLWGSGGSALLLASNTHSNQLYFFVFIFLVFGMAIHGLYRKLWNRGEQQHAGGPRTMEMEYRCLRIPQAPSQI